MLCFSCLTNAQSTDNALNNFVATAAMGLSDGFLLMTRAGYYKKTIHGNIFPFYGFLDNAKCNTGLENQVQFKYCCRKGCITYIVGKINKRMVFSPTNHLHTFTLVSWLKCLATGTKSACIQRTFGAVLQFP